VKAFATICLHVRNGWVFPLISNIGMFEEIRGNSGTRQKKRVNFLDGGIQSATRRRCASAAAEAMADRLARQQVPITLYSFLLMCISRIRSLRMPL